ncbi:MAG: hypothetical protein ACFBSE_02360 [Prochloraceae cyanobacterium]
MTAIAKDAEIAQKKAKLSKLISSWQQSASSQSAQAAQAAQAALLAQPASLPEEQKELGDTNLSNSTKKELAGLMVEKQPFDEIEVDLDNDEKSKETKNKRSLHQNGWLRIFVAVGLTSIFILPFWGFIAAIQYIFSNNNQVKEQETASNREIDRELDLESQAQLLAQAKKSQQKQELVEVSQAPLTTPNTDRLPPPPPQYQTAPPPPPTPTPQVLRITPEDLYRKASRMGVYGQSSSVANNRPQQQYNRVYNFSKNNANKAQIIYKKKQAKIAPIGYSTKGVLQDTIATLDLVSVKDRNYIIKITQHLKSPTGKIILPNGSQLIVKVAGIHPNGYIQLKPIKLQMISQSTRSLIKPIAVNQIIINASSGELLKAEVHKPSTLPGDILAGILGGIGNAAEIINRPASQTFYSGRDGFSSSTTSGNGNIPMAIAGGTAEGLSQRMAQRNAQQLKRLEGEQSVFILRAGTIVEVYINEAFSL